MSNELMVLVDRIMMPAPITASGARAVERTLEYLGAEVQNPNTRAAYMRAIRSFMEYLRAKGVPRLEHISVLHVAGYLAHLQGLDRSIPTQKQHMAALRTWLDYLVTGGVLPTNPALSVRTPRQSITRGKTPILTADEAGELLRSIDTTSLIGLRDRALIGTMVFTFARISAAVGMNVGDVFHQKRRLWVKLHEKGNKYHEMPCHHTLETYLSDFIERAGFAGQPAGPLFRSWDKETGSFSPTRLSRVKAWEMVQRRADDAGIKTSVCNHTFRGTGITTYLENGGTLEKARQMAAHASMRTTQLYDRRQDQVALDEVVKINIRG